MNAYKDTLLSMDDVEFRENNATVGPTRLHVRIASWRMARLRRCHARVEHGGRMVTAGWRWDLPSQRGCTNEAGQVHQQLCKRGASVPHPHARGLTPIAPSLLASCWRLAAWHVSLTATMRRQSGGGLYMVNDGNTRADIVSSMFEDNIASVRGPSPLLQPSSHKRRTLGMGLAPS